MSEFSPSPRRIVELSRTLDEGTTWYHQFSPVAATGRFIIKIPGDRRRSGVFGYNLRTGNTYICNLADRSSAEGQARIASIVLAELAAMDLNTFYPAGYPEVASFAAKTMKGEALDHTQLQSGEFYLYSAMGNLARGRAYRVFQFDRTEERRDGFGTPFIGVLYNSHGLIVDGNAPVDFNEFSYEPIPTLAVSNTDLFAQCAVSVYDDRSLPYIRPAHFTIMDTEQTFRHISERQAQAVADFCEPAWPAIDWAQIPNKEG